jgi:hypothetical protein
MITRGGAGWVLSETGERRGVNGAPPAEAAACDEDPAAAFTLPEEAESWAPPVGAEAVALLFEPLVGPGDDGPGDGELDCLELDGLVLASDPAFVRDSTAFFSPFIGS